jgi:hypothetical protein
MNIKQIFKENSPAILAGMGVVGFMTAIVLTAKAAPKAKELLDEMEDAPTIEKVKMVAPIYAPTAGMVLISTACIIGSNRMYQMRYGALLALYAVGERNIQRLQDAIFEEVGEKKAEKIRVKSVEPPMDPPKDILGDEDPKNQWFYDTFSGRYFRARSVESVKAAINFLNEEMFQEDFANINTFYYQLGLPSIEFGDGIGWYADGGVVTADFDAFLRGGDTPVISVTFRDKPGIENVF